jgi:hypothetical protein
MYNPITQEDAVMLTSKNYSVYTDTFNGIQTRKLPELPSKIPSDSGECFNSTGVIIVSNNLNDDYCMLYKYMLHP